MTKRLARAIVEETEERLRANVPPGQVIPGWCNRRKVLANVVSAYTRLGLELPEIIRSMKELVQS